MSKLIQKDFKNTLFSCLPRTRLFATCYEAMRQHIRSFEVKDKVCRQ